MAGGIGSRFWPMSRNSFPKQFLDILGTGQTLIQQTYSRFQKICPKENIYIVTNAAYRDLVKEQLKGIDDQQILGEPLRRNTAPCVAYASYKIHSINPDANIVVAPSDHIIMKEPEFVAAINKGLEFTATNDALLTLGIQPSRPDTGYGYIQFIDDKKDELNKVSPVKTFTEKPNSEMAKSFIKSGDFLWNGGIFLWNANSIIDAMKVHLPDLSSLFEEGKEKFNTAEENTFIENAYSHCTSISIDYGVMEKAGNVFVLSSEFGWSDLGTYGSLYEHIPHDKSKNAIVGKNVMLYDSANCIVNVPDNKLVVAQGLDDYIIIESNDVLLICKKEDEQQIKMFVDQVKKTKGEKFV